MEGSLEWLYDLRRMLTAVIIGARMLGAVQGGLATKRLSFVADHAKSLTYRQLSTRINRTHRPPKTGRNALLATSRIGATQ